MTTTQANTYFVPTTRINSVDDLQRFIDSETYKSYIEFLELLNAAVTNKKNSDPFPESEVK